MSGSCFLVSEQGVEDCLLPVQLISRKNAELQP